MKYQHVKLVAKKPCQRCDGRRTIASDQLVGKRDPCPACGGAGETETELLHPGEPFFLVRGQDKLAPQTVAIYAVLAASAGADLDGLEDLAERMESFQSANPGLVKLPD